MALLSEERNDTPGRVLEHMKDSLEATRSGLVRSARREAVGSEQRLSCFVAFRRPKTCGEPEDWRFEAGMAESLQEATAQIPPAKDTYVAVGVARPVGPSLGMRSDWR